MTRCVHDKDLNKIEIYFDCRPTDKIIELLKFYGWWWNRKKQCWYNYYSKENEDFAKGICKSSEPEMINSVTKEVPKREALLNCIKDSSLDEDDYDKLLKRDPCLIKTGKNTYMVNLVEFDITADCESKIILDKEKEKIKYSIWFEVDEKNAVKYTDFLNSANKYFSEYEIYANAFVELFKEKAVIKVIANIPLDYNITKNMLDEMENFLSDFSDEINGIGVFSARQLYFENVIVIGDRSSCMHEDHTTEELLVSIDFVKKNGDIVKVETMASYCEKCNLFFMRQHDYRLMKAKAGNARMLCQETEREKYCNFSKYDLNDHSILNVYGYTVNATDDLSDKQRQEILANIVDREILTKDRVAAYLAYFIRLSENRSSDLSVAIDKWNRDRKFILDYQVGSRRIVEPIRITVIKYKPL